ncbi:SH3 domain-containing C40 family peptidase [Yersinia aleksiciae]|uniref:SH3 domain-containing C40 family peptidase n=1 Tax=Yersinia aleksiciae TaxID=263819 RepID=UPI001427D04A|nr:SH3 domain-containing C40 family peptidase [Yersinia aleksiciae]MDA5496513.1 SH3 domain-containing protein [Yersinia aleksiciae]NIK97730.1 hydrolase [Yersinia aleksiciae]WQC69486.1 SH3 domain-containing protein [Yersinia aleksiciae]
MRIAIGSGALLILAGCTSNPQHLALSHREEAVIQSTHTIIDQTKTVFPLNDYPQNVDKWIPPTAPNYHSPFINSAQQKIYFNALMRHYFGQNSDDKSPWNPRYINPLLGDGGAVKDSISRQVNRYTHPETRYYGENFMLLDATWKEKMRALASVSVAHNYMPSSRGITLEETAVRLLPTAYPAFNDPSQAGEGYPFDTLQSSAVHPGTPIYIADTTEDRSWSYIITPTVMGWVDSSNIAKVDGVFIQKWTAMAEKNLGAVINDNANFVDNGGVFRFTARTGTLLPLKTVNGKKVAAIPISNNKGKAVIHYASLADNTMHQVPIPPTPENIAHLMKNMQGKNYGWGNIYGFNDCSAEIRNLLLPFGIFLPRNSLAQSLSGERVDLSDLSTEERIEYLTQQGKPFTTLIYIGGHVMLYIGNTHWAGHTVPMTYQNLWGLKPTNASSRSIIGKSIFFPLLSQYPEAPELGSLAGKAEFILTRLN